MTSDPAVTLALLRGLLLYALSVATAACALAAWPRRSAVSTAVMVSLAAAVALVAGERAEGLAADWQRTWRARGRLLFGVAYAALVALGTFVAVSVPEPAVLARLAAFFAVLQPLLLLLAGAMADVRLPLVNALVLVVLAALRGGPVAAAAALAAFLLLGAFLVADNALRIVSAYAARRAPGASLVLRQGAELLAPVAVGLLAVLLWAPPQAWPGIRWGSAVPEELSTRAYVLIVFAALLGAGAFGLAAQFLRRRQRAPAPSEELVEILAVEDEALPDAAADGEPGLAGTRGAVIRAYAAFVRAAAALGRPRAPSVTPSEFASALSGVAGLPVLTALFMDARYGPDEPSEGDVARAQAESAQAQHAISRRGRARRRAAGDRPGGKAGE